MRHPWTIALALALALPVLDQAEQPATQSEIRVSTVMVTIKLGSDLKLPSNVSPSSIRVKVGNEERMLDDNDKDGTWQAVFDYLLPGLYPVTLGGPDGLKFETDPSLPMEIEVEAGKNINKEITIKSVTSVVP